MIEEVPKKISVKHTPSCLNDWFVIIKSSHID
jgi:hypothetical protein